jgi:hypothetical protein
MSRKIIRKIIKFIVNMTQPVIHYSVRWDLFCPPTISVPSEIVFDKYFQEILGQLMAGETSPSAITPMQENRQRR